MSNLVSVHEILQRIESDKFHIQNSAMCGGIDKIDAGKQIAKLELVITLINEIMKNG